MVCTALGVMPVTAAQPSAAVDACLHAASRKHGIDYRLLRAIAHQESHFKSDAVRRPGVAGNSDGSTDYGLMQINSSWLPTLKRFGITQANLFDPCTNADVGAWILASNFARMGVTWNAVGAYNAVTPWKRVRYANGVYGKLMKQATPAAVQTQTVKPAVAEQAAAEAALPTQAQARSMAVYEEAQP